MYVLCYVCKRKYAGKLLELLQQINYISIGRFNCLEKLQYGKCQCQLSCLFGIQMTSVKDAMRKIYWVIGSICRAITCCMLKLYVHHSVHDNLMFRSCYILIAYMLSRELVVLSSVSLTSHKWINASCRPHPTLTRLLAFTTESCTTRRA